MPPKPPKIFPTPQLKNFPTPLFLAWKIASRYLFSKKSHAAVNVISAVSVAGVAIATAAIVVVLSVFNGFTDLASAHMSMLDPQLMVRPASGKVLADGDSLAAALASRPDVEAATPTLQERALLVYDGAQMPVVVKGAGRDYASVTSIDSAIIDGAYLPATFDLPAATVAVGVAMTSGVRPGISSAVDIHVPRRTGRINPANPAGAFRTARAVVTGVFRVDQQEYDADRVILPLADVRSLLEYHGGEATAVELRLAPGADPEQVRRALTDMLPSDKYLILTRMEQQADAFRMIRVEKWITFLMLAFIMVIAGFNIISTLSLLIIEKRGNMATMRAFGASAAFVRRVFMIEGWLVTMAGGLAGVALGAALVLAQQWGGFIRLSGDASMLAVTAYPVRLDAGDIAVVIALVALVAALISQVTRFKKL